jgi:hypothetical protein
VPRGIRNNNPGNIRHGSKWQGLAENQPDPDFCAFIDPVYGIRALAKVLLNYKRKHGLSTIRQVISRWAPSIENNTDAYVLSVSRKLGKGPDEDIDMENESILEPLVLAIVHHENGQQPYTLEQISKGIEAAK